MKRLSLLVFLAASSPRSPPAYTVYILPMTGGLDQYLADWLTREHVMQVVTDPRAADAVLTDRLGDAFEQRMAEIHPPVKDKDDKDKTEGGGVTHNAFRTTGAKGTIFLVDAKTRAVLWSDHENPPVPRPINNLNREAERDREKAAGKTSQLGMWGGPRSAGRRPRRLAEIRMQRVRGIRARNIGVRPTIFPLSIENTRTHRFSQSDCTDPDEYVRTPTIQCASPGHLRIQSARFPHVAVPPAHKSATSGRAGASFEKNAEIAMSASATTTTKPSVMCARGSQS